MSMRYPNGGFIAPGYNPVLIPGAPTIGTATAGDTQATITFTAPTDIGGSAITSYQVVSTPGNITATGSASPITVTGLTNGTAYTFRVAAINSYGTGTLSAASSSVTPADIAFGSALGGGFYAGKIVVSGITYRVIVAPKSSGQAIRQYKTTGTADPSAAVTLNNGLDSSASMNNASYPAVQFCEGLTIGGFSDWYLPSRDELELCYRNLKPGTANNDTSVRELSAYTYPEGNDVAGNTMGRNLNSNPQGVAYTSSVPAQTLAVAFQTGGSEAFNADGYWSSSEFNSSRVWVCGFDGNGIQISFSKTNNLQARAVRRVPI